MVLGELLDNPDYCKSLALKSRDYAENYHAWSMRIIDLETIYQKLIHS